MMGENQFVAGILAEKSFCSSHINREQLSVTSDVLWKPTNARFASAAIYIKTDKEKKLIFNQVNKIGLDSEILWSSKQFYFAKSHLLIHVASTNRYIPCFQISAWHFGNCQVKLLLTTIVLLWFHCQIFCNIRFLIQNALNRYFEDKLFHIVSHCFLNNVSTSFELLLFLFHWFTVSGSTTQ